MHLLKLSLEFSLAILTHCQKGIFNMNLHAECAQLISSWHAALSSSSEVEELANTVDSRAAVMPWRHSDCPIPVRPVVLPAAIASEISDAGREVVRLAVQECNKRAGTPASLAELLGVEPSPLLTDRSSWNSWAASQARPDIVLSAGVPKVLECNISGAIGGLEETIRFDSIFRASKPASEFAQLGNLRTGRGVPARRELLRRMAKQRGAERTPEIAVAGFSAPHFAEVIADATRAGVNLTYVDLEELTEDGGLRNASGRRFDLFLQNFIAGGAYLDGEPMGALESSVVNDTTLIASPELSSLLSNKMVLAWITERIGDLESRDRNLVLRHVPWTAVLRDGLVLRGGVKADLLDLLEREKDSYVIKPTDAFGGNGVVVGCEVSEKEWREALNRGLDSPHVAQQYIAADKMRTSLWDASKRELIDSELVHVISPFIIDGRSEGLLARFSRPGSNGITSIKDGASNTVFVYN